MLALLLEVSLTLAAVPPPIARWTFDGDARDSVGTLHGELQGDASIVDGRLVLKGSGHVRTAPLGQILAAKTLEARVKVDPLGQGGGGVLTVQSIDGSIFDAIVYGERKPGQWIAGSDEFRRTQDLSDAFPEEASAGFVHMAVTYAADGTIAVYRNGLPHGEPYRPAMGLQEFGALGSEVLMGMRHATGWNPYLKGEIEEAALYDRALSPREICELAGIKPGSEPNLLVNGSFETGSLSPWRLAGQPDFGTNAPAPSPQVVNDYSAQGKASFRPVRSVDRQRLTQSVATEPGQEYVLQFAYTILWEEQGTFDILINGVGQGMEILDGSLPGPPNDWIKTTWAYSERAFTAVHPSTDVEFSFPPDLGGYVRLDDVRVIPTHERGGEMSVEWAGNGVQVEEGAAASLTVRRTGRLDERGFATVELRPGTATVRGNAPEADVILGYGTSYSRVGLTFQPGQSELAVTIHGRPDAEAEAPETATLHLLPTGNASVKGAPATVTVITPPTRISVAAHASEQAGLGEITLQVLNGSGGRVRVQTTAVGTAKPGEDFIAVDTEVSVTAALPPVYVPITVLRNGLIEGEETIGIQITALSENTEVVPTELLLPLADDPVQVVLEASSPNVSEAEGVFRFSLVRTGALDSPQVFHVGFRAEGMEGLETDSGKKAAPARSGLDYLPAEGLVEFGPGVIRRTVDVTLPNDTEVDGPRGFRFTLLGSPEFPNVPSLGSGDAFMVIGDDEHEALVQRADFGPYLQGYDGPRLIPRLQGKTWMLQGGRALQLLPSGLPDLDFGSGTGQATGPDGPSSELPEPRQLSDGRLVFLLSGRVVRWNRNGIPDASFGNGSGSLPLPDLERIVHLADDGALTVLTSTDKGSHRLRRLLPNGDSDPGFVVSEYPLEQGPSWVERTPGGHFWMLVPEPDRTGGLLLRRLLPDGRPDPEFSALPGLSHSFGLDGLGRAYFGTVPDQGPASGNAQQDRIVRLLPDGHRDDDYHPGSIAGSLVTAEVSADGSLLVVTDANSLAEMDTTGAVTRQWTPTWGSIVSATRNRDGRVRVSLLQEHMECDSGGFWGMGDCWTFWGTNEYLLSMDGVLTDVPQSLQFEESLGIQWNQDRSDPLIFTRTATVAAGSQVGIGSLTLLTNRNSVRLPIQRAGNSGLGATVQGRALPWRNGRWDVPTSVPFQISLPAGTSEAVLEVSLPEAPESAPLEEWLVRLESASGTELSPLDSCRVWIFSQLPPTGTLKIVPGAGPDTPQTHWLLSAAWVQQTGDLQSGHWSSMWAQGYPIGGAAAWPLNTGLDHGPRFFRVVR